MVYCDLVPDRGSTSPHLWVWVGPTVFLAIYSVVSGATVPQMNQPGSQAHHSSSTSTAILNLVFKDPMGIHG